MRRCRRRRKRSRRRRRRRTRIGITLGCCGWLRGSVSAFPS